MADILDTDPQKGAGVDPAVWFLAIMCRVMISNMPAGAPQAKALAKFQTVFDLFSRQPPVP